MKLNKTSIFFALVMMLLFFGKFDLNIGFINSIYQNTDEEIAMLQKEHDSMNHPSWIKFGTRNVMSSISGRNPRISYRIEIEEGSLNRLVSYYDDQAKNNGWIFKEKKITERVTEATYYIYEKNGMIFRLYIPKNILHEKSQPLPSISFSREKK
jgi:hypothetical protein